MNEIFQRTIHYIRMRKYYRFCRRGSVEDEVVEDGTDTRNSGVEDERVMKVKNGRKKYIIT